MLDTMRATLCSVRGPEARCSSRWFAAFDDPYQCLFGRDGIFGVEYPGVYAVYAVYAASCFATAVADRADRVCRVQTMLVLMLVSMAGIPSVLLASSVLSFDFETFDIYYDAWYDSMWFANVMRDRQPLVVRSAFDLTYRVEFGANRLL
ncbi:hypothetical protein PINS_up013412 [Pythium insidiosum]|nr:hypothetical protein PINS_up013412 [Pythium insidiosum]